MNRRDPKSSFRYAKRRRYALRKRMAYSTISRRRRLYPKRRRFLTRLSRRMATKPVIVCMRMKTEDTVNSDFSSFNVNFNMNYFINQVIRSQVHGYLDVFDQFKILHYGVTFHLKETEELTNDNPAQPVMYHAYDPDCQNRTCDSANIHKLSNMKWTPQPQNTEQLWLESEKWIFRGSTLLFL